MFHAIAVDDEPASLRRVERLLSSESAIEQYELFNNATDALAYAESHAINLAILDIEMPETNGLTLAAELQDIYPNLEIIFITAYNQYALDAFSVHASGYLLKPVSGVDFKRELDIIIARHEPLSGAPIEEKIVATCFGAFSCRLKSNGEMIRFRTVKAEELFILLLDSQNYLRSKDYLMNSLWPEIDDPEKAGNNFRVTCSYLRKAFSEVGFQDVLLRSKEDFYLNADVIECDAAAFRKAFDGYSSANISDLKSILSLYKGAYLENKFFDWTQESRSWFENGCSKMLQRLYDLSMSGNHFADADSALAQMMQLDPYNERIAELSIKLKIEHHNYQSARDIYQNFCARMKEDLDEEPSAELKLLIDQL